MESYIWNVMKIENWQICMEAPYISTQLPKK